MQKNKIRFETHYNSLCNRPDWDGKVTLSEANKWYRSGNGEALFADINQIDLSSLKIIENPSIENHISVNTLRSSIRDGVVYGNITLNTCRLTLSEHSLTIMVLK